MQAITKISSEYDDFYDTTQQGFLDPEADFGGGEKIVTGVIWEKGLKGNRPPHIFPASELFSDICAFPSIKRLIRQAGSDI